MSLVLWLSPDDLDAADADDVCVQTFAAIREYQNDERVRRGKRPRSKVMIKWDALAYLWLEADERCLGSWLCDNSLACLPSFDWLDLGGASLRGIRLRGASMIDANLDGADLSGAIMFGANLAGASLEGACMRVTNLGGANMYGACLRGADLRGANLGGANLREANLTGADLREAHLDGANLRGAELDRAIGVPAKPRREWWK